MYRLGIMYLVAQPFAFAGTDAERVVKTISKNTHFSEKLQYFAQIA